MFERRNTRLPGMDSREDLSSSSGFVVAVEVLLSNPKIFGEYHYH